jgi:RimJ/RimL family protein N-acetyltransferase
MKIKGKSIQLRVVEEKDAEFILSLRMDKRRNKYLSSVDNNLSKQLAWIEQYKRREKNGSEYYFVIESHEKNLLGLVRLYNFTHNSFEWGSWLIKSDAPRTTGIESALLVYEFGFYTLHFTQSNFEVVKGNDKVISFHKRFGARIYDEDEKKYFFIFEKAVYEKTKTKYKKYLP